MFLNLLFVVLYSQEILIWLRVSLITESIVDQNIEQDFLLIDQIRLRIELTDVPNILMFDKSQQVFATQIQDKIGQWVKILATKGNIQIDGEIIKYDTQEVDEFKFIQIMKNYQNFFIEILKDEKYNNFVLQNYEQPYSNIIQFDTFISDQDSIITLWFKSMKNYSQDSGSSFKICSYQNFKNQQISLFTIWMNTIKIYDDINLIRINGMIWNQVMIIIQQNLIKIEIVNNFGENVICINKNIRHVVNKQLIIYQEGLYIGHFSIQYEFKQYYCSPGCIKCINNSCTECQSDQYLVDNQCTCKKFYQSQNVDGQCLMFPNLYEKQLTFVYNYDLCEQAYCPFGYVQFTDVESQINDCIKCPTYLDQLCEYCIFQTKAIETIKCSFYEKIIEYKLEVDIYLPITKIKAFTLQKARTKKQSHTLKNKKSQVYRISNKNHQLKLFDQLEKPCPYNCECSLYKLTTYCLNLVENTNFIQSKLFGIPLFLNYSINTFSIKIQVLDSTDNPLYFLGREHSSHLDDLLENIDYESLVLTGTHVIEFVVQFYTSQFINQAINNLNRELKKANDRIDKFKQSSYHIPLIHLIITEKKQSVSQIWKYGMQGANITELLIAPTIILNNIYIDNTLIQFYIICHKIILQNVIFKNIRGKEDEDHLMIQIYALSILISNIFISNCTNNLYLFSITNRYKEMEIELQIDIEYIHIKSSSFKNCRLIEIEQSDYSKYLVSNIFLDDSTLKNSYIIGSLGNPYFEFIGNFKITNSQIYGSFLSPFNANKIDGVMMCNCILESVNQVFTIVSKNKVIMTNIILQELNLTLIDQFFLIKANIQISFLQVQKVVFKNHAFLLHIQNDIQISLGFIILKNLEVTYFALMKSQLIVIHGFKIVQLKIKNLFQIKTEFLQIQQIFINNIEEFDIFVLISQKTLLNNILINNLRNNKNVSYSLINLFNELNNNITINHIKFSNIHSASLINYISFKSIFAQVSNVILTNNYIFQDQKIEQSRTLILIHSKILVISNILVYNIKIASIIQLTAFLFESEIVFIKCIMLRSVELRNIDVFYFLNTKQIAITQFDLQQVVFQNNLALFMVSRYQIEIKNFSCKYIESSQPLIQIQSNTMSRISFYYSSIKYFKAESNLIIITGNVNFIEIINFDVKHIYSYISIYLFQLMIQESFSFVFKFLIQQISIQKSNLGLVNLIDSYQIIVYKSNFIDLQLHHSIISSLKNKELIISSSQFSKIKLLDDSLIRNPKKTLLIENSIIQQVELSIFEDSSMFQIIYVQQLFIINTHFIKNECINNDNFNCCLISLEYFDNDLMIIISDSLFQSNNFTNLFQLGRELSSKLKNMEGVDIIKKNNLINSNKFYQNHTYYHIYNIIDMTLKYQTVSRGDLIKLNINDYYLKESQINIIQKAEIQDLNLTNNLNEEVIYLPSGHIISQYEILDLGKLYYKRYIEKFFFQLEESDHTNCSLCLIQVKSMDSLYEKLQSYQIQINQDLSKVLQFNMDPYNKQLAYLIELFCQNEFEIQQIQYRIKPFPCQMGEYYHNQICNLCKIEYWQNTIQKNQNKCDYFDSSIVVEMKQGLLKLQTGYWRPNYHNKYFTQCEVQYNCHGGWQVGDQSCSDGYLGAKCSECDIYNKRGSGSFSKLYGQCIQCLDDYNSLIVYVTVLFFYQLISTYLACNSSQKFINEQKLMFSQTKHYNILNNLKVDQIQIFIKILKDVYIQIIIINQLSIYLSDIINIPLNLIPTQSINKGLYCNIFHFGPNILVLELISILLFTLILIQICNLIYLLLIYKNVIDQSITYITTVFCYGYKQSYVYVSQILITQLIYAIVSNEHYLIGNQQYQFKHYKHVTYKIILPIYLAYSIFVPIITILIMQTKFNRNNQKSIKIWAYFIQNYNSQAQFYEVYQLLKYSALQVIFFYFYYKKQNQLLFFILAIFVDFLIQYKFKIYKLNKLNLIQFQTQLKVIALQILIFYYYQGSNQYHSVILYFAIMILNFYIIKPIMMNIITRLIVQYVHHTIKLQNNIIIRFPKLVSIQRKYGLGQDPTRAKENFKRLVKSLKALQYDQSKFDQPIYKNSGPCNSLFTESETSKEIELINIQQQYQN